MTKIICKRNCVHNDSGECSCEQIGIRTSGTCTKYRKKYDK